MRVKCIASGSRANAYILELGGVVVLMECGAGVRAIKAGLREFGKRHADICLITHEHSDHSRSVRQMRQDDVPCFATRGTAKALGLGVHGVKYGMAVRFKDIRFMAFRTFHDTAEPCGWLIDGGGERAMFATDTYKLDVRFPGVTQLMIECNHNAELYERARALGEYPPYGDRSRARHMECKRCVRYIAKMDKRKLKNVYLIHLSQKFSDAELSAARIAKVAGVNVYVCGEKGGLRQWQGASLKAV